MTAFGTAIGGKSDLEPPSMIRNAFGCAVIVVHHCGIDATRPRCDSHHEMVDCIGLAPGVFNPHA
jgi:hypothetical protein